jgi:predicted alpha/beta-fold hydrolase
MSSFKPWRWLSNPHAQTVWSRIVRLRRLVTWQREVIELPDGDELVLDRCAAGASTSAPRFHVILLHGLEGSSDSVYVRGVASLIVRAGGMATAMNFRSCARPNRRPRFYHSGDTGDFDYVVRLLSSRAPHLPLLAFGASLGGNVLLKWLGEHPGQRMITAAATMSVPYDLGAGARYLEAGAGPLYVQRFLRTLKAKVRGLVRRFPETASVVSLHDAMRARTFREFDDAATAPLHGFTDADDYYTRSSSMSYLSRIDTPVLCISAMDDPFLPQEVLERAKRLVSSSIDLVITPSGGHVGFVSGPPWRARFWGEETVVDWLTARVSAAPSRVVA